VLYWETPYQGFIAGSGFIAYESFYSKNKGHYLILMQNNKEGILEFDKEKVQVSYKNGKIEYKVL